MSGKTLFDEPELAEPTPSSSVAKKVQKDGAKEGAKRGAKAEADDASKTAAPEAAAKPADSAAPKRRASADDMASRQREISVSEFFTKNRHLLGFDSPLKALLTAVKEAVDNSLDACEEAGILPELTVELVQTGENRWRMIV